MDLATFGAILGYALELEKNAKEFYKVNNKGEFEELFADLARGSHKRMERIERTRREGVSEMILEPITGLRSEDYCVVTGNGESETNLSQYAWLMEENMSRFYRAAAEKIPIREVVRVFERMAIDSGNRKLRLEKLRE